MTSHAVPKSVQKSDDRPVRVRFAPSPTGFLHIGGVRTALFNWLYARNKGGKFLLRIEDTDLERSESHFTDDILASLKWLGLNWDEELIFQSKRLDVYRKRAEELIEKGHAYRCTCSDAEVEKMREKATAEGKKPKYDGTCREKKISSTCGQPFVIRAKLPLEGGIGFHDLIRGDIHFENVDLDDFVLIRSNGAPTYNLSVVVDDVEFKMSHILRGDDHINNTPKQMHLYRFFEYDAPLFAHLPMILGPDKKKLSKRHGAVSANVYRGEGYLPEALLNFLARLGWSHGDQEIFTTQEMIQFFSFDHVQKASGVFNTEKLLWLNGAHLRGCTPERLREILFEDFATHLTADVKARVNSFIGIELIRLLQPKIKLLRELPELLVPLTTPGAIEVDVKEIKWGKDSTLKSVILAAVKHLESDLSKKVAAHPRTHRVGDDAVWGESPALGSLGLGHTEIDALMRQICEQHGIKLGDFAQPMRILVTGRSASAGLFDLMALLPWDVVSVRLKKLLEI